MQVEYSNSARVTGPKLVTALANIDSDEILEWGTQSGNKREQLATLEDEGVPAPQLIKPARARLYRFADNEVLIGRPDYHSQGRRLYKCTSRADVRRAIRRGATHFTRFINAPYEFRAHIIFGKCVKMSQKMGGEGTIRNHRFGWRFMQPQIEEREPVRIVAKAAVKALGYDYGAVDVLYDGTEHAWVLEVNMAPALDDSTLATYVRHFKEHYQRAR